MCDSLSPLYWFCCLSWIISPVASPWVRSFYCLPASYSTFYVFMCLKKWFPPVCVTRQKKMFFLNYFSLVSSFSPDYTWSKIHWFNLKCGAILALFWASRFHMSLSLKMWERRKGFGQMFHAHTRAHNTSREEETGNRKFSSSLSPPYIHMSQHPLVPPPSFSR